MIRNDGEFQNTRQQLALAEEALKSLAEEVRPQSEERYATMAESYIDLIHQLRLDLDNYLGISNTTQACLPVLLVPMNADEQKAFDTEMQQWDAASDEDFKSFMTDLGQ
jgi:hypothetical protein